MSHPDDPTLPVRTPDAGPQAREEDRLLVIGGDEDGTSFPIRAQGVTVGRSEECEICLSDPSVSKRHLRVRLDQGRALAEDLGSTNGTELNGRRLPPEQTCELAHGDVLRLAGVRLVFCRFGVTSGADIWSDLVIDQSSVKKDADLLLNDPPS